MSTPEEMIAQAEEKMKKTLGVMQHECATLRTGRAAPALLDRIEVEYYGTPTPLKQLALVSVPDARTLAIQPFDRTSMAMIEKAILKSDLGLTPSNDGIVIRLSIPMLTEERRKELVKVLKRIAEEARVAVRNTRRDVTDHIKKLEKDAQLSIDDSKKKQDQIQKLTDRYTGEVDKMAAQKEAEILEK